MPAEHMDCAAAADVSIRTRPFGRVMRTVLEPKQQLRGVSIRTRPFGRVMRLRERLG